MKAELTQSSPGASRRSIQLDVLRCVAILAVMGAHMKPDCDQGITGWLAHTWATYGWLGVPLFFALSGYLISGLILDELRICGDFKIGRFLIRRGFKLYPAYFVFLAYLIAMPAAKAFFSGGAGDAWKMLGVKLQSYWPNFLFLQNYAGQNPAMHTWSLAVEEHFYILLPFLILWLARRGWLRALTIIGLLSPLIFAIIRLGCWYFDDPYVTKRLFMFATHLRMDGLAVGVGLRSLKEYSPQIFQMLGRWRWLWVVMGAALLFVPNLLSVSIGAMLVLLGVLHLGAADFGFLSGIGTPVVRLMGWVGLYSYSIYLWHATLVGVVSKVFISRLHLDPLHPLGWFLNRMLIVTFLVLGGWVAARLVEWPVLKIRERYFPARNSATGADKVKKNQAVPAASLQLNINSVQNK